LDLIRVEHFHLLRQALDDLAIQLDVVRLQAPRRVLAPVLEFLHDEARDLRLGDRREVRHQVPGGGREGEEGG
jgi:hypothetical protein